MKWLALTRVFRLGSILKVALPTAAALMAGAFWAGVQWQAGRTAQAELKIVQADQAEDARARAVQHQVSADYEGRRADRVEGARISDAELRAFIADRPDLWDCDVGHDGLRLIWRWYAPGGRDSREPAAALPEPAGADQQPPAGAAGRTEGGR